MNHVTSRLKPLHYVLVQFLKSLQAVVFQLSRYFLDLMMIDLVNFHEIHWLSIQFFVVVILQKFLQNLIFLKVEAEGRFRIPKQFRFLWNLKVLMDVLTSATTQDGFQHLLLSELLCLSLLQPLSL
jgi:hypothetical protein